MVGSQSSSRDKRTEAIHVALKNWGFSRLAAIARPIKKTVGQHRSQIGFITSSHEVGVMRFGYSAIRLSTEFTPAELDCLRLAIVGPGVNVLSHLNAMPLVPN